MKKTLFYFLSSVLIIQACSKDEIDTESKETIPAENTVIIEEDDWQESIIEIDTSNFTFKFDKDLSNKYDLKVGDIIIGKDDGGYLRKITDFHSTNSEILIETESSTILEAFTQVKEQGNYTLTPNYSSSEFWLDDGVELTNLKSTNVNILDLNLNAILYDLDGDFSTYTDQIKLNGNYKLDVDFNVDIDIENLNIQNLIFNYEINQNKKILGTFGIPGLEYSKEKKLAKIPCGTIPAGPIIIQPVIEIFAGFNCNLAAQFSIDYEQTYKSHTTVNYDGTNWTTEKSIEELEIFEEQWFEGFYMAKLYIKPSLSFKVYKTVSPYISGDLYGKATINQWEGMPSGYMDLKYSTGFKLDAGVKMQIWDKSLFDFNTNIYEWEHVIYEAQYAPPGK